MNKQILRLIINKKIAMQKDHMITCIYKNPILIIHNFTKSFVRAEDFFVCSESEKIFAKYDKI